jgi:hypothetical protein
MTAVAVALWAFASCSVVHGTAALRFREESLCQHARQLLSPQLTNAELIEAWRGRTWANPRLYSPVNRPAIAAQVHWRPESVARSEAPKDRVESRLMLQQIHGVDEKRQYFEADGLLTLQWTDQRLCFNATGWYNDTAFEPDTGCHCHRGELQTGQCACVQLGGEALSNISSWLWLPDIFILNSAGGGSGQRSKAGLEQTLRISHRGIVTWTTRFMEMLASDFVLDLMPFDSQNLTINIGNDWRPLPSQSRCAGAEHML